jgi:nitroimidazol reductase NimA-like FMN-containing flavoprotein (pyridoxamine 5'-phosphate oxidase superfamily)
MDLDDARRVFRDRPVVRLATVGLQGEPHVVPLWFVWPDDAVYLSTRRPGRTFANIRQESRVSLLFDVGTNWVDLAGATIGARAELLPPTHAKVRRPLAMWHEKYRMLLAGDGFRRFSQDVVELWFVRAVPRTIASWDHATGPPDG